MNQYVSVAYVLLAVTVALLALASGLGVRELVRTYRAKRWEQARIEHEVELIEEAVAIDELVEEIRELDRKINHYRHNIHCPACGKFARQAEGWPEGVANCGTHGIGLHTTLATGSIPIIVQPVEEILSDLPALETSDFTVSMTIIPDDLSLLLEEANT